MRGQRSKSASRPAALAGVALVTIATGAGAAVTAPNVWTPTAQKPFAVDASPVKLAALIIGASSTNPGGDGVADFYDGLFQQNPTVIANFLTGAPGIYAAIYDNRGDDDNVVLSSGWGAANASLLLTYQKVAGGADAVASQPKLYVLDNNVATPNGGFGTRLPAFALLGVNPLPTPSDPGVKVVNVVYEYDINSNIPAYAWNVPAMANSLLAYFERRLNQNHLDLPVDASGQVRDCDAGCQAQLDNGETITRLMSDGETVRITQVADTTYVGYESNDLPLVAPLRSFGDPGNLLADAATPALRAVVNYGYPNNDPVGAPQEYVPARLIPRPQETATFIHQFANGVQQGIQILEGHAALDDSDIKSVSVKSSAGDETTPADDKATPPVKMKSLRAHVRDRSVLMAKFGHFKPKVDPKRNVSGEGPHPVAEKSTAGLHKLVKRITDSPRPNRHNANHGNGGDTG